MSGFDFENIPDDEISRIRNSLMLEILAHTEAEARLRESEEKYRNLVSSLPEGIMIVRERKILFVNPGMERLTGCGSGELLGKDADLLFLTRQVCDDETGTRSMDFFIRGDGKEIFIEKSFVEILYDSSPALLFSVRDITEKVAANLEKGRLQKELERSKKMEAFGILAGGVAHDLNNVLSGLSSIPDLVLMDMPQDHPLAEQVKLIKDSGRKATAIVDELLTLARGSAQIREPVLFNDLIEDHLNSLEFKDLRKNYPEVEIVKNYASGPLFIMASKIHMQKIIMNLVSNAVEAVGKKAGKVVLETGQALFRRQRIKGYEMIENGRFLRFTVMDTGHGISEKDRDHIFEPFYSKKNLGRSGTGLGLSIVWNAVHDHQGYIHVGCPRGRTFFTLYLPLPDQAGMENNKGEPVFIHTLSDYSGNNETVLVVEDIPSQQKIAVNMLRRLGYKAHGVLTGEEAVSHAKSQKIDLALLDMNLSSGLNGCETYEQLLLIDPKIRAIITSGRETTKDVEKAKALGAGDFIIKPYSVQSLGLAVQKELKDRDKKV
nr:response regulator [Desulfobacula sp.]